MYLFQIKDSLNSLVILAHFLLAISGLGYTQDLYESISIGSPEDRLGHTAVWTGNEMIIWGGFGTNEVALSTGGRYNPSTDVWTSISNQQAPEPRGGHTAVWTGNEMIIWGGNIKNEEYYSKGKN